MLAAAILIQGDTYLRPSELLALKPQHVIRPAASRRSGIYGVIVGPFEDGKPTKAKAYDDCVLLDTGSRSDVNAVMAGLLQFSKTSEFLFTGLDLHSYGLQISKAAKASKLEALHLTPHVLRHSGASHDAYHKVRGFSEIQSRGRWQCSKSVERYKKPGRMLLQHSKVPNNVWRDARAARTKIVLLLSKFLSNRKNG